MSFGRKAPYSFGIHAAAPSGNRNPYRCSSMAASSVISSTAKCCPMHTRGPTPNGIHAPLGRAGAPSRKQFWRRWECGAASNYEHMNNRALARLDCDVRSRAEPTRRCSPHHLTQRAAVSAPGRSLRQMERCIKRWAWAATARAARLWQAEQALFDTIIGPMPPRAR